MTFSLIADASNRGTQELAGTANAMSDDHEKALQAGMDDYISKPFNFQGVKGIIETHCCRRQGWRVEC